MFSFCRLACVLFIVLAAGSAQTTQGLISGRLVNSVTGRPIAGATVTFASSLTNLSGASSSDASGYYYLPLLSPGFYEIRVTADGYQSQEIQELELTVAARIELDFRLRPLTDVWEAGQYNSVFLPGTKTIVTFFGPDVDTTKSGSFDAQKGRRAPLESTISDVIDRGELENLPLQGRDVYSLLVTEPGVTSDTATGRGLGLAINGLRPTSSNFLLDGLENNNYLITGPLTPIAPEAIQEYRVSTNNYSAEYGRTAGFLANAITRAGSDELHGLVYYYFNNDVLNANGFQENLAGKPRNPIRYNQPGYFVGGPILKNKLFFSSAFEYLSSHSFQDPFTFLLPSTSFVPLYTSSNSLIRQLLTEYPAPAVNAGTQPLGELTLTPPTVLTRSLGIERLDYVAPNGRDRVMARGLFSNMTQPDFQWTPYKGFITPLIDDTYAIGGSYIHTFRPDLTNEARASYSLDDLHFNRPHPEIPTLLAYQPQPDGNNIIDLPGSYSFYSYQNRSKTTELVDNLIWTRGRHLITVGGGLLIRGITGYQTSGADGEYVFGDRESSGLFGLILGQPASLTVAIDRYAYPSSVQIPSYNRNYAYNQFFLFAQDTFKVTRRFTVNYGLRYEYFGSPSNTGPVKDVLVQLGAESSMVDRIAAATLVKAAGGDQQIFGTDTKDIAVRAGAAFDVFDNGKTLFRGGFGTFYDRPFDNLWENVRNNSVLLPLGLPIGRPFNYLQPIATALTMVNTTGISSDFPDLTLIDPKLKNGRAYSYFAGIQQQVTGNLFIELNALGTYGRDLLTTDVINRDFSTPAGRFNNALPNINFRSDQGFSDYNAFTALVRYRSARGMIQASYTLSHWIDNQSDPLAGDFFDLSFLNAGGGTTTGRAAFSEQFNPNVDRGNSDFDQRHNFVVLSYWNLPSPFPGTWMSLPLRNWTVAGLAAVRSGFPYTVIEGSAIDPNNGVIFNPRPDIIDPKAAVLSPSIPIAGGKQLLNPAAFAQVSDGLGNEGRNAFRGPGLYNIDLSVSRSFPLAFLGETGRLVFRADAFNFLNHANLNNPDPLLGDTQTFGQALYGRLGRQSGFPAVTPLNETGRQIQLQMKILF